VSWHDLSVVLQQGTPEWPGDTPFSCGWTWKIAEGSSVNVSVYESSPHVGTHADAPLHVRDGAAASELLDVTAFIGRARVADVRHLDGEISLGDLSLSGERVERLLLRTGRSIAEGSFPDGWPVLAEGAILALLAQGLRLLGVDAPSVDTKESKTLRNHHLLFDGGASIVENLDLRAMEAGGCELVALPMRIAGLDAAPVRALARPASLPASDTGSFARHGPAARRLADQDEG
jgi:arylformamidase